MGGEKSKCENELPERDLEPFFVSTSHVSSNGVPIRYHLATSGLFVFAFSLTVLFNQRNL